MAIPVPHPAQEGPPLPPPPGAPGEAALLFRPGPSLAPEALRVARALLEDAVRHRGGRVSSGGDGSWRLVAAPPALEQARRALSAVLGGRDAVLLMDVMAAASAVPGPGEGTGTGPEAILAARPLEQLLERRPILGFGPGGAPRPAGLRLLPSASAVAAALGPRWAGTPWQAHGRGLVARRAARAPLPPGEVHLDLPGPWPGAAPFLPVLPPGALAAPPPGDFAVDGPDAAALPMLDPAQLPGRALHIAFSPALDRLPPDFWRALRPARVVLEGVAEPAALEWGLARGIARFAGPQADRVLAALRRRGGA